MIAQSRWPGLLEIVDLLGEEDGWARFTNEEQTKRRHCGDDGRDIKDPSPTAMLADEHGRNNSHARTQTGCYVNAHNGADNETSICNKGPEKDEPHAAL